MEDVEKKFKHYAIIETKPFVAHYLRTKYGSVVDITKDRTFGKLFFRLLERKYKTRDKHYQKMKMKRFSETVHIGLTDHQFYQYGFSLSITDQVTFTNVIEDQIKEKMYLYITFHSLFDTVKSSARSFQEIYDFPEDVWKLDSIIKDYNRNAKENRKLHQNFKQLLNDKIICTLSH